jgi:hypothetical protein
MRRLGNILGILTSVLGIVFVLCFGASPALASTIFTDLGSSSPTYDCCHGWAVSGSGATRGTYTSANLFTAVTGGNVSQIDLAVSNVYGLNTFYATIYTDTNNLPDVQVSGAFWDLQTSFAFQRTSDGLVTISGISGVSLNAGQSYFMILGPRNTTDSSWNTLDSNDQSISGLELYSLDGGSNWISNGSSATLGAFDILGGDTPVPEPTSLLLLGTGLSAIGLAAWRRRK